MRAARPPLLTTVGLLAMACRPGAVPTHADTAVSLVATHSASLALSPDGTRLYVANADADSVTVVDTVTRHAVAEISLAQHPPAVDPETHRYDVAVGPRAVALAPRAGVLWVTGQRSGMLYAVDATTHQVTRTLPVCAEPVGVLVSADERAVWVACSADAQVVRIASSTGATVAVAHTDGHPWALARARNGSTVYATHLLGPGITALDSLTLESRGRLAVPDVPRAPDARVPNGEARALYDVTPRPGSDELWVPHTVLADQTPQAVQAHGAAAPDPTRHLTYLTTAFGAVAVLHPHDGLLARLLDDPSALTPERGSLGRVIAGPRAVAFTPDGAYALVLSAQSEDIVLVDATARRAVQVLHPLPGHLPEGLVVSPDGAHVWVEERNTSDVVALRLDTPEHGPPVLSLDGPAVARLARDPMPPPLRLGQGVFFSSVNDRPAPFNLPTTEHSAMACASCHPEGRSAAVTLRFASGPRDTPSVAGGTLGTGFLFRTADRMAVTDFWRTINVEQGGHFAMDDPTHDPRLDVVLQALADFVDHAIPRPVPPTTDPTLRARGDALFHRQDLACATCHTGPRTTDSATGNPTLDLAGTVTLHDVGTCVQTGAFPDVAHADIHGHSRGPCAYDTPSLTGVADSAPYYHDGSAATLADALAHPPERAAAIRALAPADRDALVAYLQSL